MTRSRFHLYMPAATPLIWWITTLTVVGACNDVAPAGGSDSTKTRTGDSSAELDAQSPGPRSDALSPGSGGSASVASGGNSNGGNADNGGGGNGGNSAGAPTAGGQAGAGAGGLTPPVPGSVSYTYASNCSPPAETVAPGETSLGFVDAFPNLPGFANPVAFAAASDGRLFIVEQAGRVVSFVNSPAESSVTTVLDLTGVIDGGGEKGMLGIALHPDFATNGHLYVNYIVRSGDRFSRIARFTMSAANPAVANPASELLLLSVQQPAGNHNGGDLKFGPDGYLYASFGDGGGSGDEYGNGQNTASLLGTVVRLDVDGGTPYAIPNDNPFVGGGGLAEIYAYGLRNPWRISFDRNNGRLWAGDVGQRGFEEVNVIENGKNYGWPITEGVGCYEADTCNTSGLTEPVTLYPRAQGQSITGGFVYRGTQIPWLVGTYLYADFDTSRLWGYRYGDPIPTSELITGPANVSSFGEDLNGELYLLGYSTGRIYTLTGGGGQVTYDIPTTLSAMACFSSLSTMTPADGVLPYDLNMPLWSDGASKTRFLVLPNGGQIDVQASGEWLFPDGTMWIKHFELQTDPNAPSSRTRLETRFLVQSVRGLYGFTYRWNAAKSDATLVLNGDTRALELGATGNTTSYTWNIPSQSQCLTCHTVVSGGILGPETAQLNREAMFPDLESAGPLNQLDAFEAYGLLNPVQASPGSLPRFPTLSDASASLEERSRAYLHANCSNCHRSGGTTGTALDFLATTSLTAMAVCNVSAAGGTFGTSAGLLLSPGNGDDSVIHARMIGSDANRMPQLGTTLIDDTAADVVRSWINGVASCP